MVEIGTPELKRLQKFILLYKYPMDVGGIVLDGDMTAGLRTVSLGQSVRVLSSADFSPVCD